MKALLAMPLELRMAGLFVIGLGLGAVVNWAIYAFAWNSRPISPWQARHAKAQARHWSDRMPVVGWLGLRREASLHGAGFWIRPLLLELVCGIGLAALYWWEITEHLAPRMIGVGPPSAGMLHAQFVSHAILMCLMLAATFIDFDEKTIPDEITVPGALVGLAFAALWPDSHVPVVRLIAPKIGARAYGPLLCTSTDAWPAWLDGWLGASLGVAIFTFWCAALIPALATLRRGWVKGIRYYFASIAREAAWIKMLALAIVGNAAILAVWHFGGVAWKGLFTSLVGLAFGGGLIWAVRIVGTVALQKEAMGFGDVTLMAMIGAFLGWQACLVIVGLSPLAALVVAATQWVLTGRRDIAFGPYLCLGAVIVIVQWPAIWRNMEYWFDTGWLLPIVLAACLMLMMGLLMLWRMLEQALFGR